MKNFGKSFKFNWKGELHMPKWGLGPEADWKMIFVSTVLLTLAVIISSMLLFVKIRAGEIFSVKPLVDERPTTLDLKLLSETTIYYEEKAVRFEEIKVETAAWPDPSL